MASVIDYYGDNQDVIIANAGPGHWNDPDMVRNLEVTYELLKYCNTIMRKLQMVSYQLEVYPKNDDASGVEILFSS